MNYQEIKSLNKEQFEALLQLSQTLNTASYEESLIEQMLDWVLKIINAERTVFAKFNEAENKFKIISARNYQNENIYDLTEFSENTLKQVLKDKKPILYHNVQSDPNFSQFESVQLKNIQSIISVPILRDDKIWGIVFADTRTNRKDFTQENLIFLNFFANLAALALDRIISFEKLRNQNIILQNRIEVQDQIPNMIGESKPMRQLAKLIHKVAKTDATVLILGESGTGKDLAAQAIHNLSERKDEPYLAQFCGSIPDDLLMSELFGYKKGAFTGANQDKKGLLEVSDNGTFFLDEIADISGALQAKLLRVLENREIIRLGDTNVKKVDVRIIAATNKDLKQLSKEGNFREDLFYRLNVFPITIPPLRERREDIILIAQSYIKNKLNKEIQIDAKAVAKLESYYWPGNVRQLINVIQRAAILCDQNKITEDDIILEDDKNLLNFDGTLKEFEILLLKKRLEQFDDNRTQTAKSLGVSVRWVQLKLKELGESEE